MSKYLVDTDWVVDFLKGKREKVDKLSSLFKEGLNISVITLAELYEGVYASNNMELHLRGLNNFLSGVNVLGIDEEICKTFGKERTTLRKKGKLIDNFDLFIAATCLTHNLILITDNIQHFKKIKRLKVADFILRSLRK